jgi:hypothetical protein
VTLKQLAAGLGVSLGTAWNLKRDGIPTDDLERARAWHALRKEQRRAKKVEGEPTLEVSVDDEPDSLEAMLPRIRGLANGLAIAAEQAFREHKLSEAISLRREHVSAIRTLYEAESKLIKIQESRGKLIPVEKALAIVNNAIQSGIVVLRRLPELGKTPEERRRLEAFLNAVLTELKDGAAAGAKL